MSNKIYSIFALCILFAIPYTVQAQTAYCPADLNFDRFVDSADVGQLLLDVGHCPGCSSDLNLDEHVNSADLGLMLVDFGNCPDDNGGSDCPPYRTFKQKHHFDKRCNGFVVGYQYYNELYTGNGQLPDCQTFKTNYKSKCIDDQTLIGTIGNLDYFADGNCGCYSRPVENPPICPAYATIAAINWEFPIVVTPVEGNCGQSFQVGLGAIIKYHDGNCNTFWADTYFDFWWWYPNGYRIGGCNEYTFYSNGNGGYYSERNCTPYGTFISSSSEPIIADGWTVGTATINVYADGNCGSYQDSSYSYLSYGTFLGSDGTYNYYSDGAGGYYTDMTNYNIVRFMSVPHRTLLHKKNTYIPYISLPVPFQTKPIK